MSQFDLREWLRAADEAGELQRIGGADAVLEIGAASELNYRRPHPRALLFDEITGYRPGRRVLTSSLSSPALMGLSLGLGPGLSDHDLVEALRGRPAGWAKAAASYPAEPVDSGPVFDNVVVKGEIDFLAFPSPLWHEKDGGRYIGTGCAVVTTDPGSGLPNVGAYRIQVQDDGAAVSINMEAGRHGAQNVRAWFAREGRAPVAVSLGHHPVFLMVSGTEVPLGLSELDYAGAILGERVPVVRCPDTGLPLPAESELAFEGWLYPDRTRPCSMRTLAAVATGNSDNLLARAADVTLKERRRLVLVTRETPLSYIHIRNMETVTLAGATVLPPVPAFYHRPSTIDDLLMHTCGKVLDQFGLEHDLYRRWAG